MVPIPTASATQSAGSCRTIGASDMHEEPKGNGDRRGIDVDVSGSRATAPGDWRSLGRRRKSPPDFTCRLLAIDVDLGETVNLTCVVVGEPAPRVWWTKDEDEIRDSRDYELLHIPAESRYTLVINRATRKSEGSYRCIAENSEGRSSTVAFLAVRDSQKIRKARFVSKRPRVSTIKEWRSQEDLTCFEANEQRSDDEVFDGDLDSEGDDGSDQWISVDVTVDALLRSENDQSQAPIASTNFDVSFDICL